MKTHVLTYKGKSTTDRFKELQEAGKEKELVEKRATLEGKVVQDDPVETNAPSGADGGLAVAVGKTLYVLDVPSMKARWIVNRESRIKALAVHDNELYDAGGYGSIFITNSDKEIVRRNRPINCLVSYEGKLYDVGEDNHIYNTLTDIALANRKSSIWALIVHLGDLYDAGEEMKVFETIFGKQVASRNGWIHALASHNNKLYDAGDDKKIFKTQTNEIISRRKEAIFGLASCNGKLYDGCVDGKIFDSINDNFGVNPLYDFKENISAMCTLPKNIFERLCHRGVDR